MVAKLSSRDTLLVVFFLSSRETFFLYYFYFLDFFILQYSVGSDIAHYLMARHDDTPMIDKETHRLAVVNMDWDHIKAVDLYMVMTSWVPKGGRVLSVSIYPSEFGLECMNIE
uniref:ESF1 RRM domain-containing protein n=1 Tax=Aegilops tauschii subsp. strangulata TaxID=200361 RepID=A0A453JNK1_AEGTS